MVTVIVLCAVTVALVIVDLILVYALRVQNRKAVKLNLKKLFRKKSEKNETPKA